MASSAPKDHQPREVPQPAEAEAAGELGAVKTKLLSDARRKGGILTREDVTEALQCRLLDPKGFVEASGSELSLLHEQPPETRFEALHLGVGVNHAPPFEPDAHLFLVAADEHERAGLSLQADQLENVGQAEIP